MPVTRTSGASTAALAARLERICTEEDRETAARTLPVPQGGQEESVDPVLWCAHACYQRTRDGVLREILVDREYRPQVQSLASSYHRNGDSLEELVQVAFEGLLSALQRFDVERRVPFLGYAKPTIIGALKRHYRDCGWSLRVPRRVHELVPAARNAQESLALELGRAPTLAEAAERLGCDVEDLLLAQEAAGARATQSWEAPSDDGRSLSDVVGLEDRNLSRAEDRMALREALKELSPRDREVLSLYFFGERSQHEIARSYGVSQMQVSRWIGASTRRLRSHLVGGTA